jgi:RNA-directed DNA polymerase
MPSRAERRARSVAAAALLGGAWEFDAIVDRLRTCGAVADEWVEIVATRAYEAFPRPPRDAPRTLASWLATIKPADGYDDDLDDEDLDLLLDELLYDENDEERPYEVTRAIPSSPVWQLPLVRHASPVAMGPTPWPIPPFASVADVADAWDESIDDLRWLADRPALGRTRDMPPQWNYRYRWTKKRSGGWRLIEAPRPRLAHLQRRLLQDVLDRIPSHPCAYGFVAGRSVADFASEHVGRGLVVRIDLEDFFPSVSASRVFGIFRTAGYPEPIAHLFTAIATTRTPAIVRAQEKPTSRDPDVVDRHRRALQRLAATHLPQGAPTSPSLANLAAFRLDQRLQGLAASANARYSRYADDLVFSWSADDSARINVERWAVSVTRIAADEQFRVNDAKTRSMRAWQRQEVGGIVVNERCNIARPTVDRVRAMVHRATTHGLEAVQGVPPGVDPAAHLLGLISWVEFVNPSVGARLRTDLST